MPRIAAIDQGTTSTRCIIFDADGTVLGSKQLEHAQLTPHSGWVDHDPEEILRNTDAVIRGALEAARITGRDLEAVGISNQRETTVAWNAKAGALAPAIVWQDVRTAADCRDFEAESEVIRARSGLPISTYFSAPKMRWMLHHEDAVRAAGERGDLRFGTIDSWLVWHLTGGKDGGLHVTDTTNASRTLLADLHTLDWHDDSCAMFGVDRSTLPQIVPSSGVVGLTRSDGPFGAEVPIAGILGDQQAAAFGQACFQPGDCKNTYGTGCFLLQNTGTEIRRSSHGLLTTVAYSIYGEAANYAIEGSIAVTGALVQWLRDRLGIIESAPDIESVASTVDDCGDVYFVPAFSGLFAPHWQDDARGTIIGLTFHSGRGHICRAALEAAAYQTRELVDAMNLDSGKLLQELRVDGGMVDNNLLMQIQADVLGIPVVRPAILETTALGAAYAAGLATSVYRDLETIHSQWREFSRWEPTPTSPLRDQGYARWQHAVEKSKHWTA